MSDFRHAALSALFFLQATFLYADASVLLKFKEGTPENIQKNLISRSTPTAVSLMEEISVWRLKFPSAPEALEAVKFFNNFDETKYCYKSRLRRAFAAPNDPNYASQWGLSTANGINMEQAWNIEGSSGSASIIIAVIDTGVDYKHEDLSAKMWTSPQGYHGYDFADDDNDPKYERTAFPSEDHATHVAGIAAAGTDNGIGIAGVAVKCRIMSVRVLKWSDYYSDYTGSDYDIAAGICWAVRNGARVINMSLGGDYAGAEADACAYAFERGVFIAAASGNDNTPYISYPAALSTTFAVGAVNESGNRCSPSDWVAGGGSNYGPNLDVLAPGNNILSTVPSDSYDSWDGTSMATPFVAGLASIILSIRPDYGPGDVAEAIRRSGSDYPTFTNERGYGVINANDCIANLNAHIASLAQKVTVFPNPLRASAGVALKFAFSPAPSSVNVVRIFDFAGQEIVKLDQSSYYPSSQLISWDGKNSRGAKVASGIYFYFAETNIGQSKGHFAVIK
ncbi:MAG: S8 family serine peptidase [Candidatus Omnitrophota bacterium]|nr:S8 family serine peptidase [Candidatus Omnitrophota bacterium]MBU2528700.1 S8 family serine peptidase [bacterium]MBU3929409.1 S8 family serine peptidase [bacterium]MBU4123785.1 S8 family serine peptidase [bacterium]